MVQSIVPNGVAIRSGYPSAYPIGRCIVGIDSCAIVEPSVNSTIEWTTDCGCTTTSMSVVGRPVELVGLDHLEALVHQRAAVDR